MALRPYRNPVSDNIDFFTDSEMERGGVVCLKTGGSGEANDDASAVVEYAANPSGKVPVGVLMNEVRDIDLTRQVRNMYQDEVVVGGKCTIQDRTTVTTDMIYPSAAPAAGDDAYLASSGLLTADGEAGFVSTAANPLVGRFLSSKDEDGFAKVTVNLP